METKVLPILYKKTSTGAIQQWRICVEDTTIVTVYGQVDGKLQTTTDQVKSGKSAGKKNATTPEQQALKEAQSRWEKQKKMGYVESLEDAKAGKTDSIIEGGITPMLAKVFEDHVSKIKFPVAVQPKLDGHRCIAHIDSYGKVTLWSRTRKRITSVPHIEEKIAFIARKMKLIPCWLDGELYNHNLRSDFEKLSSAIRKKEPTPESKKVQYHVYDMVDTTRGFKERIGSLSDIIMLGGTSVVLVDTMYSSNQGSLDSYYTAFIKAGYEGAMVRTLNEGYHTKRSDQLLKMKTFQDTEFVILGVEEGRGKLAGHAGSFVCQTKDGKQFNAKMSGETAKLKEYWENGTDYIGGLLTVKYQGLTSDGIPRFPVGLRIREDL